MEKIYFQPGTNIGNAIAQITSSSSTSLRRMPRGIQPPYILQSNASNVPVAQLTMTSTTMSEEKIADYGQNFLRLRLFTVPGLSTPAPYGGKTREITIDVDPKKLAAKGLVGHGRADGGQQLERVHSRRHGAHRRSRVQRQPELEPVGGRGVRVDPDQGRERRADHGRRRRARWRTDTPIRRTSCASTASARRTCRFSRNRTRRRSPSSTRRRSCCRRFAQSRPQGLELRLDFDQSVFVRAAVSSVVREAFVSALLVSLMILGFLGSWRSVIVAIVSIPLAIACAIVGLRLTGNSFNIMTLGGLSLSIGLLVDNATITVENIHRNRSMGKPLTVAILDGAAQISLPVIMATLAICIVFFPVVLLTGPARFLFVPMALAVVVAMLASYVLSRTLVKTLSRMLLAGERAHGHGHDMDVDPAHASALSRFSHWFNTGRDAGIRALSGSVHRVLVRSLVRASAAHAGGSRLAWPW